MEAINMNIIKKTKEHTTKLSISGKIKKCYRLYCMVVVIATLIFGASVTAFAANDPIVVINNLSGFIFGLIRAVGLIFLGFAGIREKSAVGYEKIFTIRISVNIV